MNNAQFPALTQIFEIDILPDVSIEDHSILSHFSISPNPVTSDAVVSFILLENNNVMIEVYDLLGSVVYQRNDYFSEGENHLTLDTKNYPNGSYSCRLVVKGKQIGNVNFVVSR